MLFKRGSKSPALSVIVVFFNMAREAERTLYSLSRQYQGLDGGHRYEVVAIDHGSARPLSPGAVSSFGPEFSYHYVATSSPSPCETINRFIMNTRFENVMVLIDGARMLSPGILILTFSALKAFAHPFVYTLGMHLGSKPQNYLAAEGHNQTMEDELLEATGWKQNGYRLFSISSVALSSKRGFFSSLSESNCFSLRKDDFVKIGLYRPEFKSPGGGLCNLEVFNRLNEAEWLQPVMLLGEATFHQFHGGVATNVPIEQHPWESMEREYAQIVGERYRPRFRPPLYLGFVRQECTGLYNATYPDGEE